jgi:hypothetical protein
LIEQILSYKILFFDIVSTIGYALSPAMNNSLHAGLEKISAITALTIVSNALKPIFSCVHSLLIWEVQAVPRLCKLYPVICLTIEENARKSLS